MIDDSLSAEIKAHILASFKDTEVIKAFTEHILSEVLGPAIKKELAKRDEKIEVLQKQLDEKVSEVDGLKMQIDEIEQYSRKYCINIKGVPETQREDPIEIVMNIANGIGVTLQASDIDVAHRIGRSERTARGVKTRDLCVKFRSYQKRQEMWQSRKALRSKPQAGRRMTRAKGANQGEQVPEVFMYENLTRHRQKVMYVARELKRANKLWAVWSDGGVMKVKKTQTSSTVIIKTEADVQKIAEENTAQPPAVSARAGSADARHREEAGGAAGAGAEAAGGAAAPAPGGTCGK
ncbi:hypothetical protein FJT64_015908 [Amphibalanus amphitrite]|uniref:Uncharacterized protein n=1 Tax=Amphibalanus amphitrite TaxID=1232801 RepID=A0A6A4X1K7_AMPAM|nr:hypothetical protein FJT64_015908 [Amphibalanus amphitrite]